jgi:cobalt/nickel transport system permease protein
MGALGFFRVPDVVILTPSLALKNIVALGNVALEMLEALRLRSVGRNRDKSASIGGIGGVLFLKSGKAAETTTQAMRCRGFEGDYRVRTHARQALRAADLAWAAGLALLVALFLYLQPLV